MSIQNAKRDENYEPTLLGVDSLDLITPQRLTVDSATNRLLVTAVISSIPVSTVTNDGTFAKETGGNLATIAGKDFATQTTLALVKAKTDNLDVALSTRLKPADTLTAVTTVGTITNVVHVDDNSGSLTVDNAGTFATQASQSGTWATGRTWSLSSGSDSVTITPSGTQTISGTVTANAGTNLNTSLLALESGGNLASIKTDVDNLALNQGSTTSGQVGNLVLTATTTAAPTYATAKSNPLSTTTTGALRTDSSATTQPVSNAGLTNIDVALSTRLKPADTLTKVATVDTITNPVAVTGTFFQVTQPVSIAATVVTQETQPTTPTETNITMTGSSVTLFALNTARRNAMVFNDSGVIVYVKFGSTASATSFTVKMVDQAYYELPNPVYTGIVTALGASGVVRVTEVT